MKNLLIVGASGGIGKELTKLIDNKKYNVILFTSKDYDVRKGFLNKRLLNIDIVINLSGLIESSLTSVHSDKSSDVIDTNCKGVVNILADFLPYMILNNYGRIIFLSSVFSVINIESMGVYSASKAFVDKLVKIASIENAKYGVTINSIQLGYTEFGMGKRTSQSNIDKAMQKIALKRFCSIEEIYNTVEYIINTEYITGTNIRLDGGIK